MKRTKLLFFIPVVGLFLSSCNFSLETLMFWKKKDNQDTQQKEEKNDQNENQNDGGNQQGGNEQGANQGGNEGGNGGSQTVETTVVFDFATEFKAVSGSKSGISFTTDKADGASAPAYNTNSSELRLYVNNTLTITAESTIGSIIFNANTCTASHEKADATLFASTGKVSKTSDGFSWTGSSKSVTFTCVSGRQVHINSFTVNLGEGGTQPGGDEGGGEEHVDSETLLTLKSLITPIACDILSCEADDLIWLDYDSDDDADIYYVDEENLTFVEMCAYSTELSFDEAQALLNAHLPNDAELDDDMSMDLSEYGYAELWYKTGDYYYILTVQSGEDEETGADAVAFYFDIVLQSQGDAYSDYFSA